MYQISQSSIDVKQVKFILNKQWDTETVGVAAAGLVS